MPLMVNARGSDFALMSDDPNRQPWSPMLPSYNIYQRTGLWPVADRAGTARYGRNITNADVVPGNGMGGNYAQQVGSVYQPMTEWPIDPRAGMISTAPIPGPSNFNGIARELRTYDLTAEMGSPYQIFEQTRR